MLDVDGVASDSREGTLGLLFLSIAPIVDSRTELAAAFVTLLSMFKRIHSPQFSEGPLHKQCLA